MAECVELEQARDAAVFWSSVYLLVALIGIAALCAVALYRRRARNGGEG